MALTITDKLIRTTDSRHEARAAADGWQVSWLPGQALTHSQAVSAMQIAAKPGRGVGLPDDPIWLHIDGWAREMGLSGPNAGARASEPPARAEPEAGR